MPRYRVQITQVKTEDLEVEMTLEGIGDKMEEARKAMDGTLDFFPDLDITSSLGDEIHRNIIVRIDPVE
jgi:hypothetical protein